MQLLIVDDDAIKADKILQLANETIYGGMDVQLATSAGQALDLMKAKQFDVMIVDINLPWSPQGRPEIDGGVRLVRALDKHTKGFKTPVFIIGLTAFTELQSKYAAAFGADLRFLVHYNPDSFDWRERIGRLLIHAQNVDVESNSVGYESDIAIVSALQTPELDAFLEIDCNWQIVENQRSSPYIFHVGTVKSSRRDLKIVAATATRMGMPAATVLTCHIIEQFRPRYLGMIGIAAGVKGNFGDVLVADRTWDYGSGKSREAGLLGWRTVFEPDPHQIATDDSLLSRFAFFRSKRRDVFGTITESWSENIEHEIGCQIGPIASGAAVLENRPMISRIKKNNRKLIGIEMETYGVYVAATMATEPRPRVFSAKSICDFGDSRKSDNFQRFAAYSSARFTYEFIIDQLSDAILGPSG